MSYYVDTGTAARTAAEQAASEAADSKTAVVAAKTEVLEALDAIDDRNLGAKASDPSVDNDGNALLVGAQYFNTTDNTMRVYNGTAWQLTAPIGALIDTNNLSDVTNTATAKANLSLDQVNNTSDANKPISTATQTALDSKVPIADVVDNLVSTDTAKPLSAAQGKTLQDGKVDKVAGKGLTTNDYTTSEKNKLAGIESGANVTDTSNVVAALTAGSNIAISTGGVISATDTTYSVGDGGLTQNNFTNALKSKLDGIETSADITDTANVVAALTAGTDISIASDGTISSTATAAANTTYQISWVDSNNNALLRLTPSSGTNDDLSFVAGTNITLTPSGDNLTFATTATVNDTDANLKARANHTGTQAIATVNGLQPALDAKEPAITKNTAFNKNFGTASGTVTEGNDSRLSDSRTCNNSFDNADTAKTNLSLNNVENKSSATIRSEIVDSDIPASIARDTEVTTGLSGKVDKVTGKGLSTHDLTTALKDKLDNISDDVETLTLPANTTISDFGKTLVDDTDAATARTTLGLGTAATTAATDYATAAQGTTADNALPKSGGAMTGPITTNSTVDGRDVATDGAKLDGIESGATADQTAAEIRTLVDSATDSNVFTDADHTKLNNIESNATADQTGAEIKSAYEGESDTNAFTDAEKTKLTGIETGATADQTGAEIKTAYEGESDTNAFTDVEKSKLAGIEASATADQTDAEIEAAYNNQVAQVSSAERTAGTETGTRRHSPADIKYMIDTHAGQASVTTTAVNNAGAVMNTDYNAGTLLYAGSDNTPLAKTLSQFSDLFFAQDHYMSENKLYAKGTSTNPDNFHSIGYDLSINGWKIQSWGGVQIENHLLITGSSSRNLNFGYLAANGTTGTSSGNNNYGIYANNRIAASEFNAHSDARIKNIIGVSDGEQDAEILQQIKVTDFTYKETGQAAKKVIAQQLEKIYPQAVSKIQNYIPDILREAESLESVKQKKHYLTTITLTDHGLTEGEFVELESSAHKSKILTQVIEITNDSFTVQTEKALPDAFVVGKRVDDFRVVDYEAIAMLAVSALQDEMKRRERMEKQLMELRQRLIKLESSNNDTNNNRETENKIG